MHPDVVQPSVGEHWLRPLLAPESIAIVGMSPREGNVGLGSFKQMQESEFSRQIFPVNPRYDRIGDLPCYPSLTDLPDPVDLVVLAVADELLEEQMAAVIRTGCRAAVIFGAAKLPGEDAPKLADRLSQMARAAGLPVCGAGSVGFCNYLVGLRVTGWPSLPRRPGGVTWLSHSGSAFGAMTKHDFRAGYNFAVSIGQEFSVCAADYMDYALTLPSTRVIALFLETVREPDRFRAALERADRQNIPVVALNVGRTAGSAHMALSHAGALAGDGDVFSAVCRRYGVIQVEDIDTLMATVLLFENERKPAPGGLASVHESGGERQMVVDLASDLEVPFADIEAKTVSTLAQRLAPGLVAENPCDIFGNEIDMSIIGDSLSALLDDPNTALAAFFVDLHDDQQYASDCLENCYRAMTASDKPVVVVTHYSGCYHRKLSLQATRRKLPVLDGAIPGLLAIRNALKLRDWQSRDRVDIGHDLTVDRACQERWITRLANPRPLDELEGLDLLADYGIATPKRRVVLDRDSACRAAGDIGFPVVVKTAEAGILHKAEHSGVYLGLGNEQEVADAYDDLAQRLGPRVMVAAQIPSGVEIALGIKFDPQFGPAIVIGAGGTLVELLRDSRVVLAPSTENEVSKAVKSLAVAPLLDGYRDRPPADKDALINAILRLSVLASDLGQRIREGDINPLIVGADGAWAADALFIPGDTIEASESQDSLSIRSPSAGERVLAS